MAGTQSPTVHELDAGTARRISEAGGSGNGSAVLSLYLDLDPSEFATPPARASAIRSLVDDAARQLDAAELSHDAAMAARADLDRARRLLEGSSLPAEGARAVALFVSSESDLFDVVKLPRKVPSRAVVDRTPWLEPLVDAAPDGTWCVLLVNRSTGRILMGDAQRMTEVAHISSDVHGRHDQGGWSQKRYERSVEREVDWHVEATLDELFKRFQRRSFRHLLIGGPEEMRADVQARLHPYLAERLEGSIEIDVENTSDADVCRVARPVIEANDERREREALDRLREGIGRGGRAAGGLEPTLAALNERRVEILLLEEGFESTGVVCPACGWLGTGGARTCPADGTETEPAPALTARMIDAALEQAAEVRIVRHHPDLGPMGRVGAVTRF